MAKSSGEFISNVIDLIPSMMHYPEDCKVEITIQDDLYASKCDHLEGKRRSNCLTRDIGDMGKIDVIYMIAGAQFLEEEISCIDILVNQINLFVKNERLRNILHELEDNCQRLLATSTEAILVCSSNLVVQVNQVACDLFGYSESEMVGLAPRVLAEAQTISEAENSMNIQLEKGATFSLDRGRSVKKDGTQFWTSSRGWKVYTRDFGPCALIILSDLSDQCKVEREARNLKYSLDMIDIGVGVSDIKSNRILYVNDALAKQHHRTKDEMIGLDVDQINCDPDDKAALRSQMNERGRFECEEVTHIRPDGTALQCLMSGRRIHEGGEPVSVVTSMDITRRKAQEKKLLRNEKMRLIGQLAAGIAHDFNNQLVGIMGCAEVLKPCLELGGIAPEARDHVNLILSSASQSRELVANLLSFARKEGGTMVPVDINGVVRNTVRLLAHSIGQTIHIEVDTTDKDAVVMGDAKDVQSALMNIGINARDAMPGGGKLVFRTRLSDYPSALPCDHAECRCKRSTCVKMTVTDSGVGMDEETQKRVFEPFFTTKNDQGTGLGLASVYAIVAAHGGDVHVESAPGAGTSVIIELPGAHSRELNGWSPESPTSNFRVTTVVDHLNTRQVMLIDDDPTVRKVQARMLELIGFDVHCYCTGEEAVAAYQDNHSKFDLVVCDFNMPGIDGEETLRRLKAVNPDIKLVIATGYSSGAHRKHLLALGAKAVLLKPFMLAELAGLVKEIMGAPLCNDRSRRCLATVYA